MVNREITQTEIALENIKMVEINFLCIHPRLRNKRLSPVLIKEATRRTNLHNMWQAFYTTDIDLPNCLFAARCHGWFGSRHVFVARLYAVPTHTPVGAGRQPRGAFYFCAQRLDRVAPAARAAADSGV